MTMYRFVTQTDTPDQFNASLVEANDLAEAIEKMNGHFMDDEPVVSINLEYRGTWLILQGEEVYQSKLSVHPKLNQELHPRSRGNALKVNLDDPTHEVVQPIPAKGNRFDGTPVKTDAQRTQENRQREVATGRRKGTYADANETPAAVAGLWILTLALFLAALGGIATADYQMMTTRESLASIGLALTPAIVSLVITGIVRYLCGIYFTLRRMEIQTAHTPACQD